MKIVVQIHPCTGITSGQEKTECTLSIPRLAEDQLIPSCKGFLKLCLQSIIPYEALGGFERLHRTDLLPLLLTLQQYLKLKELLEDLLQSTGKFPRPELQRAKMNWAQCFHLQFPSSSARKKKRRCLY